MSRNTNSGSVRTRFYSVVSETPKSIVIEVGLNGKREHIRVPKALCRNWQKDTVDIYAGYFSRGVTVVNVMTKATTDEFDVTDDSDVLRMLPRYTVEHKQWIVDEVMTAYTSYERLRVG